MSTQHTPGPWLIDGGLIVGRCGEAWHSGECDDSEWVCRVAPALGRVTATDAVAEANSRLIASAPDLLEACKRIYHSYGETSGEEDMNDVQTVTLTVSYEVMAQLAAAIAKAEGREA